MADQLPKMPASFKAVVPFIRRAEELDRDSSRPESKLIAYFCRQYAMELGIKVRENDTSAEATEYLLALMDRLEDDKNKLPEFTQQEGKEICEDFALEIFTKADNEDRAGAADKNTARTFYAAGTFFDILNQFGDISDVIAEKRKYCKFKAAMILKAIKEGRTPTPGPPAGGMDGGDGDDLTGSGMSFPSAPSSDPTPTPTPPTPAYAPPPPPPQAVAPPSDFPSFTQSASIGPMTPSEPAPPATKWDPPTPAATPTPTPSVQATTYSPPPPPPQQQQYQQPVYQQPVQTYASPPPPPQQQVIPARTRNGPVSQNEVNDAIECAKFAIAALKVKDLELAAQRLEAALRSIR
ncbi:hypothetical protein PybrP1_009470 [[Pythium] brassicae (nom. inval.)]|nr:hypothetical protein PybrP1_009470 [[Pythium] brassicae (nom. inval.)]